MNNKSKKIALYGTFAALIVVSLYLETLITAFFLVPPAIISLALAMAFALSKDLKNSLAAGVILGGTSCLLAWTFFPQFIVPFGNPLVSVLPRIYAAAVCYFVFLGAKFLLKNINNDKLKFILPCSIGAAFGVLTNTVYVLLAITYFVPEFTFSFGFLIGFNFLFEFFGAIILAPAVVAVFKKVNNKSDERRVTSDEFR